MENPNQIHFYSYKAQAKVTSVNVLQVFPRNKLEDNIRCAVDEPETITTGLYSCISHKADIQLYYSFVDESEAFCGDLRGYNSQPLCCTLNNTRAKDKSQETDKVEDGDFVYRPNLIPGDIDLIMSLRIKFGQFPSFLGNW